MSKCMCCDREQVIQQERERILRALPVMEDTSNYVRNSDPTGYATAIGFNRAIYAAVKAVNDE